VPAFQAQGRTPRNPALQGVDNRAQQVPPKGRALAHLQNAFLLNGWPDGALSKRSAPTCRDLEANEEPGEETLKSSSCVCLPTARTAFGSCSHPIPSPLQFRRPNDVLLPPSCGALCV